MNRGKFKSILFSNRSPISKKRKKNCRGYELEILIAPIITHTHTQKNANWIDFKESNL